MSSGALSEFSTRAAAHVPPRPPLEFLYAPAEGDPPAAPRQVHGALTPETERKIREGHKVYLATRARHYSQIEERDDLSAQYRAAMGEDR